MTQLTDKVFAAPVPDKVNDFKSFVKSITNDESDTDVGKFQFLFTTKSATEEQAASVVQIVSNGKISGRPQYRRYDRDNELPARMWTRDARHSLETLLRSKGLDPDKNNYALIEKL